MFKKILLFLWILTCSIGNCNNKYDVNSSESYLEWIEDNMFYGFCWMDVQEYLYQIGEDF